MAAPLSIAEKSLIEMLWLEGYRSDHIQLKMQRNFGREMSLQAVSNHAARMGLPTRHRHYIIDGAQKDEVYYDMSAIISPNSKRRKCLRCRNEFLSYHAGNRICATCKSEDNSDVGLYTVSSVANSFGSHTVKRVTDDV